MVIFYFLLINNKKMKFINCYIIYRKCFPLNAKEIQKSDLHSYCTKKI